MTEDIYFKCLSCKHLNKKGDYTECAADKSSLTTQRGYIEIAGECKFYDKK